MAALDFPSNPTNGQVDPSGQYVYDSSITSWRNIGSTNNLASRITAVDNSIALKNMVPSSVTAVTGTSSATSVGQVSFTSVSKVILNNVFTSDYLNYKIVLNLTATTDNSDMWIRFTAGGTENSSTSYRRQGLRVNGGTLTTWTSVPESLFYFCTTGNQVPAAELTIFSPQPAKETKVISHAFTFLNGTFQYITTGGWIDSTAQFDGFSLAIATGTFSGTMTVYGFND